MGLPLRGCCWPNEFGQQETAVIGESEKFINQLENLPIYVDTMSANQVFSRTINLARTYKLSSYDACHLELAVREGLPIATLNKALRKAAKKADVDLFSQ